MTSVPEPNPEPIYVTLPHLPPLAEVTALLEGVWDRRILTNGGPLLSALSIARNVIANTVLRKDVGTAAREVKTGGGLARNLAREGHFPRLALQMISVGEETGQLDTMLLKVSDTYDKEVRNTIDRLLSVFTPVVTLFLAVLIGTIVLSVLLAILSVNDLVG